MVGSSGRVAMIHSIDQRLNPWRDEGSRDGTVPRMQAIGAGKCALVLI
jgi:hypothetical protein